jgi:CRP/FNR family transcriptional regulator, cyclic AMP receptor protein
VANEVTSQEIARLLGKCLLFQALGEEERHSLVARMRQRTFKSRDPIFHVGAPGQSMLVILKGSVRVSLPGPKGKVVILADIGAGELLGEVALLDGKERSADATALTNCTVAVLERRDVVAFLENRPRTCLKLLELMCARLRKSDERMAEIAFFELPARLAKVLLDRARALPSGAAAKLSLSQSELASMINASRENVNRCLRDWQRRGIVSVDERWISVLQRYTLTSMANYF